jgi:DNA polymerase-3 subunit delta
LRAFQKHLQGASPNHFSPLYLIISKNGYERKEAQQSVIKAIMPNPDSPDCEFNLLSGSNIQLTHLLNELNTISFFCKKRLVVVQDADKLEKGLTSFLENYFEKPNPGVYLILTAESVNKSTNFYKKSEKHGVILDCPEEKSWEKEKSIQRWIAEKVAADGKQIDPQAVQYLIKRLGHEQELIHNELEKLYCYIGDRGGIAIADIAAIGSSVNVENVWQLGDAIFSFDVNSAMRISKALVEDGSALLVLLRQLRTQFESKYQICSLIHSGQGSGEVMKQFPYMKGQILNKNIQQAQHYGMNRFKNGLIAIDLVERQAKNSLAEPDLLLELLIVKLTTK